MNIFHLKTAQNKWAAIAIHLALTFLIALSGALLLKAFQWSAFFVIVLPVSVALPLAQFILSCYQKKVSGLTKVDALQLVTGIALAAVFDTALYFWYF